MNVLDLGKLWKSSIRLSLFVVMVLDVRACCAQSAEKDLQIQHDRYVKAQKDRDYGAVLKLVTNDFVLVSDDGRKLDRKALEKVARTPPAEVGGTREQVDKVQNMKILGKQAVIMATQQFHSDFKDRNHVAHKLVNDSTFKEQWVNSGGTWKLRRVNILKQIQMLDGKPIKRPAPQKAG